MLIHHIEARFLPGGFIGVDVFFVISGFLITSHIVKQRALGAFSFSGFYWRRARRIIPNQLLVIAVVLIVAAWLFDDAAFEQTAASAAYSAMIAANVFFWQNSGYFAPAAETMPLLHMWSLAVEEQFYLIWPAAMAALALVKRKVAFGLVVAVFALLAIATEFVVSIDPSAAFYLAPFRVLEFACGGLLAFWRPTLGKGRDLATFAALAVIFACLFLYSEETRFPGLMALIPCTATAVVIAMGGGRLGQVALGNRIAVAIGNRSYAMYLVHWPVIVFLEVSQPLMTTELRLLTIAALTALLTETLYQFWEKPLRYWDLSTGFVRLAYGFGVATAAGSLLVAGMIFGNGVIASPVSDTPGPRLVGCRNADATSPATCEADILVIGDSHAGRPARLIRTLNTGIVARSSFVGCPPVFGAFKIYNDRADHWKTSVCQNLIAQWEAELPGAPAQTIVLAARWAWLSEPGHYGDERVREDAMVRRISDPVSHYHSRRVLREQMDYTIRTLLQAGKTVVLISQVPKRTNREIQCAKNNLAAANVNEICRKVPSKEALARLAFMNGVVRDLGQRYPDLKTVVLSDAFCNPECDIVRGGALLYHDDNHMSDEGAALVAKQLS